MNVYDNGWVVSLIGLHFLYKFVSKSQLQARCDDLELENAALRQQSNTLDKNLIYLMEVLENVHQKQLQDQRELNRLRGQQLDCFEWKDCQQLERELLEVMSRIRAQKVTSSFSGL